MELDEGLKDTCVQFKIFDKDIFSPDDFISSESINFDDVAKIAFENEVCVKKYGLENV